MSTAGSRYAAAPESVVARTVTFQQQSLDLLANAEKVLPLAHPVLLKIELLLREHPFLAMAYRVRTGRCSVPELEVALRQFPHQRLDLLEIAGKWLDPCQEDSQRLADLLDHAAGSHEANGHWKARCTRADVYRHRAAGSAPEDGLGPTLDELYTGILSNEVAEVRIRFRNAFSAILLLWGRRSELQQWTARVEDDLSLLRPHQVRYTAGILTRVAPNLHPVHRGQLLARLSGIVSAERGSAYTVKTALKQLVQISPPDQSASAVESVLTALSSSEPVVREEAMLCLVKRIAPPAVTSTIAQRALRILKSINTHRGFLSRALSWTLIRTLDESEHFPPRSHLTSGGLVALAAPQVGRNGLDRVVKAVVIRGRTALALEEAVSGARTHLSLPGGKPSNEHEPNEAVLVREIREETGLKISPRDAYLVSHIRRAGKREPYHQYIYLVWDCSVDLVDVSRDPDPNENLVGFRWIPLDAESIGHIRNPTVAYGFGVCMGLLALRGESSRFFSPAESSDSWAMAPSPATCSNQNP